MSFTAVFLCPPLGATTPPDDYSPDLTLDLRDKTVKEFLSEVEKKSEYVFFYFENDVDVNRKVSVTVRNKKIGEILDLVFRSTTTGYSIKDKQIYLSKKGTSSENQSGTTRRVTGRVTDGNGVPLPGATVVIRNSQNATVTNLDGLYVIDASEGDYLIYSFVGYLRQELPVGKEDIRNVVLIEDTQSIQDIVVVGYGKQEKASVVSSVATIGTTELSAPTANLTNNLAGQLAGLISIQRSAEPGRDDAEFWIRGISTFAGSGTTPLVLVDGIPRVMSNIEADEIETFTLLKDAAATAVYGAEGANGVILITTKRGVVSKPQVSFRAEYSLSSPTRLPEFVDSWDYLELANEANFNDGLDPYISQSEIEKYRQRVDNDLYPNSKWLDELLSKHTSNQRYTLSFRGGAERAKYFVSLGYFRQEGLFKENPMDRYKGNLALQRYNVRSNIDLTVTKTTTLSVDIAGQYVNKQSPRRSVDEIFGYMLYTPPHLFPSVYSDGTLATYPRETDNNNRNPYNMLMNEGYKRQWDTKIQSNISIAQDLGFITAGLRANGRVSLDYDNYFSTERKYDPTTYHATGRDENDDLVFIVPHSGSPVLANPTTAHSSLRKIYIEASVNYQRTFADRHAIGGMLLYMQKESQRSADIIAQRMQGLVGRTTYAYDNRYFIEGNFGYTGSETFAKKHRFGFFPAVGLGYFISNERFYPDALKGVLSKAKLRVSYGRTGNDATSERYLYRATFSQSGGYFDQGMGDNSGGYNHLGGQGIYDQRFVNTDLKWEIERKSNFGLDLGLFNKVDITADYFYNRRSNIIVARNTIPGVAGFHANPYENYGKVDNWGFDASMNAHHNFGPVRVSMRGTFTFARNKILENDELPQEYPWMGEIGRRVRSQRLYIAERLYTEDDFIRIQNHNGTYSYKLKPGLPVPTMGTDINYLGPGDIKFKDLNGDGVIDLFDMTRDIGYPYTPEINYGFGINVDYKGMYISVFFQGTANTSMLLASGNDTFFPFNWGVEKSNYRKAFLDNRWKADDPRQDALMPRLHVGYAHNINRESSTWWLRDGSFLRLKNVEVGYNLPRKVAEKIYMSNARIYVMGYNLAVWDKIKMWDPELGTSNKGNGYPLQRTFTFGIEVTF